ncbi:radical SAM protein [bacterium]|nr:radical SAM protein [bacterium]MBU1073527.1 radical SAM protein [bacterium]MBU1676419.1 radical SAM protein [bacterium]
MGDLKGLHVLLTYTCLYECDHCFLYCGPSAEGTFTLEQVETAIAQADGAGVEELFFEGGEPFLYYPLLEASVRLGKSRGLSCHLVTNCYWATTVRDAELWLAPLREAGLDSLSVSDDAFHCEDPGRSPARRAREAARNLGLAADSICIEAPAALAWPGQTKGEPVVGGDVLLKGRAVEKLAAGLPRRPFSCFTECTGEELASPSRVHLDPFGNVFVCQGVSIGNIWRTPLAEVMAAYDPSAHPIVGPLLQGGPAALAERYGLPEGEDYVSDCHLCYLVRCRLLDRFPEQLCPRQVYGPGAG